MNTCNDALNMNTHLTYWLSYVIVNITVHYNVIKINIPAALQIVTTIININYYINNKQTLKAQCNTTTFIKCISGNLTNIYRVIIIILGNLTNILNIIRQDKHSSSIKIDLI